MATEKCLSLKDTILKLFDVDGLKFGSFVMRTGEISPFYIDMRVIWSYPDLVVRVLGLTLLIIAQTSVKEVACQCVNYASDRCIVDFG